MTDRVTRAPAVRLYTDELVVDSFAGGGGASLGISWALGRGPDVAINHDAEALALHAANHPETRHLCEDVWAVDPVEACAGRPVGLMWLSPDCKHFSKAKGGRPVNKKIRGLAWVAVRWAKAVQPRVIVLENVEEFQTWGPVLDDGRPCPARRGLTFRRFVGRLRNLGYAVEWRELRACDYGAPTSRKRLFLIARRDGRPIVWPAPTHGKGRRPYRTAAEVIDWTLAAPSIFERTRPLAENTLRRIANGIRRFVIEAPRPFIVNMAHGGSLEALSAPMTTIKTERGGCRALVVPTLVQTGYGEREGQAPRVPGLEKPLGTVVSGQKHALVAAFLARHYTGVDGAPLVVPVPTVTAVDHHSLVAASLVKLKGTSRDGQAVTEPLHTVQAGGLHYGEVRAFLVAYYGNEKDGGSLFDPIRTVTSKDRMGLVTVAGREYAIADIGMRMLAPRELYRAQGFPDSYRIEIPFRGKPLSKSAQVRMCGNSVVPLLAEALVRANLDAAEGVAEVAA
jgi:DNA (cytosine-5)-methyltransferase 1